MREVETSSASSLSFCGGVAQAFHDDRVVELKEQLGVEEEDGKGQEEKVKEEGRGRIKENAPRVRPWMTENKTQNLSHEVCGVITSCGRCAVRAQCMYATRPLKCKCDVSTSSLVYLLCIVNCMLLFTSFHLLFVMML